jgi:beta-catenin-like protein 1
MLSRKNKSLEDVIQTLKIYHDNVDDEGSGADSGMEVDGDNEGSDRAPSQQEILKELITYLERC